jgi:serine/threonine protein kinase
MSSNKSDDGTDNYTDSDNESSIDEIDWRGHIINSKYLIINNIGSGSYCTVWNVYDIENKKYIAFKIYNNDDTEDAINEKKIMDEIRKLNIKNIVIYEKSFLYKYEDDEYIIDIMPQYGYSLNDIRKLLRENLNLNDDSHKKIYNKYIEFLVKAKNTIIDSLKMLHNNDYVHSDIKPENILLDIPRLDTLIIYEQIKNKANELKKKLKYNKFISQLSDFAVKISENINVSTSDILKYLENFDFNIKLCDMGTTLKNNSPEIYKKHTSYYKSPMIILKYPLNKNYDYWSLSCTFYELITFNVLFDPFEENLVEKYSDIEDFNLLYLIISTIGLPSENIIKKSQMKDIYFTFDYNALRYFNKFILNPYIDNILSYSNESNKKNMLELLCFITQNLNYTTS